MKTKLIRIIISIMVLFCIVSLYACDNVSFKINFFVDDTLYESIHTNGNEVISIPRNPEKEGYVFDGWFCDKDTWENPFTANSLLGGPLPSDMSVYAK